MVSFELYAVGRAAPAEVAAMVHSPRRLPEWTDVEAVVAVEPEPVAEGGTVTVRIDGRVREWRVVTARSGLLEAETETRAGVLGAGARVLTDPRGSRVVLAVALRARRRRDELVFRVRTAPALLRRLDRWARTAVTPPAREAEPAAARPAHQEPARPVLAASDEPGGALVPGFEARVAARSQGRLVCFTCRVASPAGTFPVTALRRTGEGAQPDGARVIVALRCPACGTAATAVLSDGPDASGVETDALALLRQPGGPPSGQRA